MYFPESFLLENSTLGSQGSVLVHEWAKYRWGVFEEYGHRADPIFPSATKAYEANETLRHTYCTDGEVAGNFYQCEGNNLDSCYFVPSADETTEVTSSLLATPFLSSVVNFCTSETHVADVPTKHNLLCEKRSTWDVIKDHSDITGTSPGASVTPSFLVKRLTSQTAGKKLVFLLDVTAPMGKSADTWNYLRDAVRQFILSEATDGMQVGLVSFTDSATIDSELVTLDSANRQPLANKVPNSPQNAENKKVAEGISKAKQVLGAEGTVILVTENMKINSEDLVAAADGTPVWPILYPHLIGVSFSNYQNLADAGGVSVFPIEDKTVDPGVGPTQSIDNRVALTRCFLDIQYETQGNSPQEIISSSCSGSDCQISLEVPANTNYEDTFFIEIYFCNIDGGSLTATVRDPMGITISIPHGQDTNSVFRGTGLQAGTYTVEVSKPTNAMDVKSSLLATLRTVSGGYAIKLWSSLNLQHLEYTPDSAPTLFAMVSDGDSHVVYARVTATVTDSGQNTAVLVMRDDGTGADVTGNDGVYSAYLIGLSLTGSVSVQVSANDNGGLAKLVTAATRAAPVDVNGQACCGSQITFLNDLPSAGTFSVTSNDVGEVTGTIPTNFPPGRVTDLRSSLTTSQVNLTFTAPGDELDQGTAEAYLVTYSVEGSGQGALGQDVTPLEAGALVSTTFPAPDCGHLTFLVRAVDAQGMQSADSNEARISVPCVPTTSLPSTTSSSSSTENPNRPLSSTEHPTPSSPVSSEETPTASITASTTDQSGDNCSCVSTETFLTVVIGSVVGSILAVLLVELLVYVLVKLWQRRRWKKERQREVVRPTRGAENPALDHANSGGNYESRLGERRRQLNYATPTSDQGEVANTTPTPLPYLGQSTTSINQAGRPILPSRGNQRPPPRAYNSNQDQYGNPSTDAHRNNNRGNVQYNQRHDQPYAQPYNQYNYKPQNQNRRAYTPNEYI
ncbi:calcium-activated chloride channel regulator 4A-like [Penaeus chinensis]|uniref:calcium-activated chloride channel regulator 4A-like n=1 Tax=Penaeus chinensis TaxID=139456 RepID=UPI001FB7798D|nr:calcium-activated chloride channel regulator 4A-like [Penaeus chinensis]